MLKWMRELKKYNLKDSINEYYEQIINENGFDTYDVICSEVGTPEEIYRSERESITINLPTNQSIFSFDFKTSLKGLGIGILDFIISVILFTCIFFIFQWFNPTTYSENNLLTYWMRNTQNTSLLIGLYIILPIITFLIGTYIYIKMYKLEYNFMNILRVIVVCLIRFITSIALFTISSFSLGTLFIYVGFITSKINWYLFKAREDLIDSFLNR